MRNSRVALTVAVVALAGCENTGPHGSVSAVARFYNGPTPAGTGSAQIIAQRGARPPYADNRAFGTSAQMTPTTPGICTAAKCWFLSPDRITMTLTSIQAGSGQGGAPETTITVNCPVTYDKSAPGLTQLVDCPFSLPLGTYSTVNLYVSSTVEVLINDAVSGFYSTPAGIVTSPPAGGAQPFSFTIGGTNTNEMQEPNTLPTPLQVAAGTPVTLSVIVNGLQSLKVAVTTGGVVLGWPGTSFTDPGRPDWAVATGSVASVAFYSNQLVGTTGSYCVGGCPAPVGIQSVNVYYGGPTTPEMVGIPINGLPKGCGPFGLSWMVDARSYLGLDGAGNISWAIPTDGTYSSYAVEMQMAQVSTIGASTTLYCKNITTDPAPQGGSFASGAPGIASGGVAVGTFILLAH